MTLTTINDLNSLGTDALLPALEITIPGLDKIYVVKNRENITFNGNEYLAFDFQIEDLSQGGKGELPTWVIKVDNSTRILEQYILNYDLYLKQNGIQGNYIECIIRVLNTNDLSEAILEEYFELNQPTTDAKWATFNLSASSPFRMQYPTRRIFQNLCQWKFKDNRCAYSGSETVCNKSLTRCQELNNTGRFGAFLGVSKGIRL